MTERPLRVAAYGYFGMGNLGNEGSLAAFLAYMRRKHPTVVLSCFAAGPEEVEREHGVPATQLMTYRPRPGQTGPLTQLKKVASRLWDVPRTFAMMRNVDVMVVPGTGVLSVRPTAPPWGLPYWLFLATLACRLRRRRVALVSVGGEYAQNPVTRRLYRWTVRLSDHCSYRDETSRCAVREMGVRGDPGPVFPDLVFSLPSARGRSTRPGHVVIGVMAYKGGPDNPRRGPEVQREYAEQMTALVITLLDRGRTVALVIGDEGDREFAAQITDAVRRGRPGLCPGRVWLSDASTLEAIMEDMSEAEVVIGSRFHNVVCALKMVKPTISLGYADKNDDVMAEFGLGAFCQSMESFDLDRLLGQIKGVEGLHPSLEGRMKETLQHFEDELDLLLARLDSDVLGSEPGSLLPRRRRTKR
jgi:polysaccharide pyruvyl transferase WcaK-like protein